ncbi:hypothetical protein [Nostoc sp. ChiVER01]|nr:hypothetical protein [Nostoc sp. ChiVER01]MDZ8226284.1 hypothetical protein [Nostoc sp. ChiVER01]
MVGEEIFSLSGTIFWAQLEIVCIDLKSAKPKSIPCDLKQAIKTSNKDLFLNTIPISNTETLTPSLQIV